MPVANDFLIGLIAGKNPSARAALSALAIHRDNPKITASIAAAVEANGSESVRDWFRKKFPAEAEAKVKKKVKKKGEKGDILSTRSELFAAVDRAELRRSVVYWLPSRPGN